MACNLYNIIVGALTAVGLIPKTVNQLRIINFFSFLFICLSIAVYSFKLYHENDFSLSSVSLAVIDVLYFCVAAGCPLLNFKLRNRYVEFFKTESCYLEGIFCLNKILLLAFI